MRLFPRFRNLRNLSPPLPLGMEAIRDRFFAALSAQAFYHLFNGGSPQLNRQNFSSIYFSKGGLTDTTY